MDSPQHHHAPHAMHSPGHVAPINLGLPLHAPDPLLLYGKYSPSHIHPNLITPHFSQVMTHVVVTIHINAGEQTSSFSFFHTRSWGHVAVCNNIIVI